MEEPLVFLLVFKTHEPEAWKYTLPEMTDEDGDLIVASLVVGSAEFITLVNGELVIEDLSSEDVLVGEHSITINLKDNIDTTPYEMKLVI